MRRKVEGKRADRRARRSFTASFKAEVVALVRQGDRTIPTICREMDLSETAVRRWGERWQLAGVLVVVVLVVGGLYAKYEKSVSSQIVVPSLQKPTLPAPRTVVRPPRAETVPIARNRPDQPNPAVARRALSESSKRPGVERRKPAKTTWIVLGRVVER